MTTLTARTPEDILAAVPVVLGFHPAESVVLLTFGAVAPFHARVDLPPPGQEEMTLEQLLEPSVRLGVRQVVLLLYTSDAGGVAPVARALRRGFRRAGIGVVEMLAVDETRWHLLDVFGAPGGGSTYDVTAHPFLVESVVGGVVTHRSRADLAASIDPDVAAGALVAAELGHPASAGEAIALVEAHARDGTVPGDRELAGILVALVDRPVRDAAWLLAERETAERYLRLWSDVVRRAPPELAASPMVLLAATAWLAGHGALAWCALDRLFVLDPDHSLGQLVATLLEGAVPPGFMATLRADCAGRGDPGDDWADDQMD